MKWNIPAPAIGLVAVFLSVSTAAIAQDAELDLDQIIERHVEARGGYEALKGLKTIQIRAKIDVTAPVGSSTFKMTLTTKKPRMAHQAVSMRGVDVIMAFDGTKGWTLNPFMGSPDPQVLDDNQRGVRDQYDWEGELVDYEEKGSSVELVGPSVVAGDPAYEFEVRKANGDVITTYLSAESFLEVKRVQTDMTGAEGVVLFGDYKEVDGVLFSHRADMSGGPQGQSVMVFESIEVNPPIPDSFFAIPGG